MWRTVLNFLVLGISLLLLSTAAQADVGATVVFSKNELSIIADWYHDHGNPSARHNGKGGKKAKGLPPGIAKNLARGKSLPPGIAKQALPHGLEELLPRPPRGYERVIVDGKILLVEVATRVVHDILTDVILR